MQRLSFSIVLAVALVSGLVFGVPASAKPKKPTLGEIGRASCRERA